MKTFIYYGDIIPIDELDNSKSTPLHWAAFSGSEKVAEYLLAQRTQRIYQNKMDSKQANNKKKLIKN